MIKQSYQKVSKIIEKDLLQLKKSGVNDVFGFDFQDYFYKKQQENPKRYERLFFNTNGHKPYCEDLESILGDLRGSGFLKLAVLIVGKSGEQ